MCGTVIDVVALGAAFLTTQNNYTAAWLKLTTVMQI